MSLNKIYSLMETLNNEYLTIQVRSFGAELTSIVNNETGKEYLWQGDAAFWKRQSPVLFPIVGSLWNGEYRNNNIIYKMFQHGFARDNNFELISSTSDEVYYSFKSNEETIKIFPFPFELQIGIG